MTEIKNDNLIYRENPPTFPLGFRFAIAKEVCIIDFIDIPDNDVRKVSYSIAITKNLAKDLIDNLDTFINEK